MSDLTNKVEALVAEAEEKGKHVEASVLADVRAVAERLKQLVGVVDDKAKEVSDDAVAVANEVENEATPDAAPAPVHVSDGDEGSGVSAAQ